MKRVVFCLIGLLLAPSLARADDELQLYAAGSLTAAMAAMLSESGLPQDRIAAPVFGPSGVLRERIEAGASADVLASADMGQARRLAAARGLSVIMFTRNSLCAIGRAELHLTAANVLDRMLDPTVKLGTSTPGADPGGDYAWAVFARAEALHPGAKAGLEAKALKLVGGADSKPLVPGKGQVQGVFLTHAADMMLGYCSGAAAILKDVPGLESIPLPRELTVGPAYGMVVLTDHPLATRFALFVMSEKGQAILARYGFRPVGVAN